MEASSSDWKGVNEAPVKSRLGQCEVCGRRRAKYTCPRCEVKTCSLDCNRIHKAEVECTGERNKTRFIPLRKFTNLDLSSDYRFMEEVTRVVDNSRKGGLSRKFYLKRAEIKLQQQASARGINLKFLPSSFLRRRQNTTRFDFQAKRIEWRVEFVFDARKIPLERVPETERLGKVVDQILSEPNDDLQFYQSAGLPGIKILLKAEQKSGRKFYEIDPTFTLQDALRNKTIIEFPSIYVILKHQRSCYEVLDSDDEDESERLKSGQEVINTIVKKSENDGSLYDSLQNLLFVSEYSDDE